MSYREESTRRGPNRALRTMLLVVVGLAPVAVHALWQDPQVAMLPYDEELQLPIRRITDAVTAPVHQPVSLEFRATGLARRATTEDLGEMLREQIAHAMGIRADQLNTRYTRTIGNGVEESQLSVCVLRQVVRVGGRDLPVDESWIRALVIGEFTDPVVRVEGKWFPNLVPEMVERLPWESESTRLEASRVSLQDPEIAGEALIASVSYHGDGWKERLLVGSAERRKNIEFVGQGHPQVLDTTMHVQGYVWGEIVPEGPFDLTIPPDSQLVLVPLPHVAIFSPPGDCFSGGAGPVFSGADGLYDIGVPPGTAAYFSLDAIPNELPWENWFGPRYAGLVAGQDFTFDRTFGPGAVNLFFHMNAALEWLLASGHWPEVQAQIDPCAIVDDRLAVGLGGSCNASFRVIASVQPEIAIGDSTKLFPYTCNAMTSPSVIAHELGHYLDHLRGAYFQSSDLTLLGLSEGWGDMLSAYYTEQPLIANGYLRGQPSSYLRDVSQPSQYCAIGDSTCGSDYYRYGGTWAAFSWTLREALMLTHGAGPGADRALELMFSAIAMDPQSIPDAATAVALVDSVQFAGVDRCLIYSALEAHGIPNTIADCTGTSSPLTDARTAVPQLRVEVFPNPGSGPVRVVLQTRRSGPVEASVFDVSGRRVATLVNGPVGPGEHAYSWEGATGEVSGGASGVYFVRVQGFGEVQTRKVVRTR